MKTLIQRIKCFLGFHQWLDKREPIIETEARQEYRSWKVCYSCKLETDKYRVGNI